MKKILLVLLIALSFNCSSTQDVTKNINNSYEAILFDYTGIMSEQQMSFIHNNYDWEHEKLLIINFTQPRSYCHFDNSKNSSESRRWWFNFYSKVNTANCSNIFVGKSESGANDKDNFLLNNFFKRKISCYGIMVINNKGQYLQYNGHYSEKQVSKFIEKLS